MRIAALGDSITFGYPFGRSWTHIVAERLKVPLLNFGLNGDTLPGMLMRLEADVLPASPDYCIVMGGANDAFSGDSADTMLKNAAAIAARLGRAGVPFAWGLTPPVLLESLERTLDRFRQGLQARGEACIDFTLGFYADKGHHRKVRADFLPDGVHPSDAANAVMAEIAIDFLNRAINT